MPDDVIPPAAAPSEPAATPPSAPAAQAQPASPPPAAEKPAAAPPKRVNPYAGGKPAAEAPKAAAPASEKPASDREALRLSKQAKALEAELAEARPLAQKAKAALGALTAHATTQLGALPKEWQEYVRETAGEDPIAQLKSITALQAKGLLKPAAAALPAGATTAPPAAPKPADSADADVLLFRKWDEAKKAGRTREAAAMLVSRGEAIARGKQKSAPSN